MTMQGMVVVMTGPSGTGKSSVVRELLASEPSLRFSVSHTTRPARAGERDGVEYRFVTAEEFHRLRSAGLFLEWAEVHGHLYGTSRSEIDMGTERGEELLLDIDVQGARQVALALPRAVTIFILPPDFATMERRLRGRGTEREENIERRLRTASSEVRAYGSFAYVIVNEEVPRAAEEIRAILRAERLRTERRRTVVERIVATFPS